MTDQVCIKYVPRDILALARMKENPAYEVIPRWAHSQLTNRDKYKMGNELAYLRETEPTDTQEEREEQYFHYYRDYWMEMTLKFMVDRGIDWARHPRYTGDYVEEEEDMVALFYEEDIKYLENLDPNNMSTNEEKLVDQLNAIGDLATCPEEAGEFLADEDSAPVTDDQNVGLIDGAVKMDVGVVLGKRTEWIYKKAEKAGIGMAVMKAGGRKKDVGAKQKGRVGAGKNLPKYTKLTESISDQERETIARERHEKTTPKPLQDITKRHKLPCAVCHPTLRDWLKPLSRKNAMTHPPKLQFKDGILLIPSEDSESEGSDRTSELTETLV